MTRVWASVTEIGALFGSEGDGMSAFGEGLKGAATFFGAKSQGNRFVFVVDNSNSMTGGRLETALLELGKAVNKLQARGSRVLVTARDRPSGG